MGIPCAKAAAVLPWKEIGVIPEWVRRRHGDLRECSYREISHHKAEQSHSDDDQAQRQPEVRQSGHQVYLSWFEQHIMAAAYSLSGEFSYVLPVRTVYVVDNPIEWFK